MKNSKINLLRGLIAAVMAATLVTPSQAEATREITSDAGLYSGNRTDIFVGGASIFTVDANYTNVSGIPEGTKCVYFNINQQYGWWGVQNRDASNQPTDVSYAGYAGGALRFWLRSTKPVKIEIAYKVGAVEVKAPVRLNEANGTNDQWQEIVLPLSGFAGLDLNRIVSPFILSVENIPGPGTTVYVDHVRYTKALQSMVITPATTMVENGKHRQFTVEGRDGAGEAVLIYPTWSVTGSGASVSPNGGSRYTILTAGSANGTVTATADSRTANASFTIGVPAEKKFGILSESIPGLIVDEANPNRNGYLAAYGEAPNGTAQQPALSPSADAVEGVSSTKTVLKTKSSAQAFQGWAVQFGVAGSPQTTVRDMSTYYDGAIKFWFKGADYADLRNKLMVSIRSGNVTEGQEAGALLLSRFATFNNGWVAVSIPLSEFAKAPPYADLSRTKIFFNIFVRGAIAGTDDFRTFYIDNLRWEIAPSGTATSLEVTPNDVLVPTGFKRLFVAKGFDINNNEVDVSVKWTPSNNLGTVNPVIGPTTIFTAGNTTVTGTMLAQVQPNNSPQVSVPVRVAPVNFPYFYNVYSELGVGGHVGVSMFPSPPTGNELVERTDGTQEGIHYYRFTYSLSGNSYAGIYIDQPDFGVPMQTYANGYLSFLVRTNKNLEISIRSIDIPEGGNNAKVLLSELGVPLDNQWQRVIVPLDLFERKDNRLDFNEIKVFFAITAASQYLGTDVPNQFFELDDVKWLTDSRETPDHLKIYQGLRNKQVAATGLVRSYNNINQAFTYDNALAAMAFTYRKNFTEAAKILDFYRTRFNAGGFEGFYDNYNVDTGATLEPVRRTVGPNAYLMLALIHYKNATGSTAYDQMLSTMSNWLFLFQDTDGAVRFGNVSGPLGQVKSTEHNLDVYAVIKQYLQLVPNASLQTKNNNVLNWLKTQAWNAGEQRFNVGERGNGTADTDKALDIYSWPIMALGEDSGLPLSQLLAKAEADFGVSKNNTANGNLVKGFDFGNTSGRTIDKDAVWLEGTAQMALAYLLDNQTAKAAEYVSQMELAIYNLSDTAQGLTYATNVGTPYGDGTWMMDADPNHASVSSMAWYLFAKYNFNPFQPSPLNSVTVKNISDNTVADEVNWTVNTVPPVGNTWVRANQYIEVRSQPMTIDRWGIQIYTDNKNTAYDPHYVDPTANIPDNPDSDPSGLLFDPPNGSETTYKLPFAWSVKDVVTNLPTPADPNHNNQDCQPNDANAYQWNYMQDKGLPAIKRGTNCDPNIIVTGQPFNNGSAAAVISKIALSGNETIFNQSSIHVTQGPDGFVADYNPQFVFFAADFNSAAAQSVFTSKIVFEFFLE